MDPDTIWRSYYTYDPTNKVSKNNATLTGYTQNLFVYDCIFSYFKNKRVISIQSGTMDFLHSGCEFDFIIYNWNGAVFRAEGNHNIVQRRFTVTNSYTTVNEDRKYGHFCEVVLSKPDKYNVMTEGNAIDCGRIESGNTLFHLAHGNMSIVHSNFTNSKANLNSLFYVEVGSSNCEVNYTIGHNSFSSYGVLWIQKQTIINHCTFTNNTQKDYNRGLFIAEDYEVYMIESYFLFNRGGPLFHTKDNGKIYVSRCVMESFSISGLLYFSGDNNSIGYLMMNFDTIQTTCECKINTKMRDPYWPICEQMILHAYGYVNLIV